MMIGRFFRRLFGGKKFSLKKAFSLERLIGLALLGGFITLYIADPYPVQFARVKTFDMYQRFHPREIPPPEMQPVTIVDIDERSLKEIGQWPWSRVDIAKIVINLIQGGARSVAFDMVFAENDRTSPPIIAEKAYGLDDVTKAKMKKLKSHDAIFGDIIKQARIQKKLRGKVEEVGLVILGQAVEFRRVENENAESDPPPADAVAWIGLRKGALKPTATLPNFVQMVRNIPELEKPALSRGLFSLLPEPDGIVRRVPTFFMNGENFYPSLGIEMLRASEYAGTAAVATDIDGVREIRIRKLKKGVHKITTDPKGRVWPYFSKRDYGKYLPAVDVLNGTFDKSRVKGKMMIVGTSATGLLDIRSTPVDSFIPGVEVHAQFVETILANNLLQRPAYIKGAEIVLLFATGLIMIILVPWIGAKWTLGLFVAVAGGTAYSSWYLFTNELVLMDAGFVVVSILLLYTQLTYTGYAREEAQRRQVRDAFGFYLAPAMVEKLADDPTQLKLGGETRDMTMLFCDVRGFTTISEQFDAEGLTTLINKLLTPLTGIIMERNGTVDKYMGDCIMAFWNAPLDDEMHAHNACIAALLMNEEMEPLNERLEAEAIEAGRKHIPLKIGTGLNSGDVVVGNMGSEQRFDYSILGDQVNLAARLEGQCKTYVVDIVIGENTYIRAPEMAALELDLIKVKGKTEAVRIYTLVGDQDIRDTEGFAALGAMHVEMLDAYRGQRWDEAKDKIIGCRELSSEFKLGEFYDIYDERLVEYAANPPGADWDGVFVATSK
ncbi:MAG: adenylate/guanylate cyclase domain-containing protein [Rhodospirillales bacterium]|nr:adenylate/guanylate cyclase domain-containing protein [Rhodospirillales bacterium]